MNGGRKRLPKSRQNSGGSFLLFLVHALLATCHPCEKEAILTRRGTGWFAFAGKCRARPIRTRKTAARRRSRSGRDLRCSSSSEKSTSAAGMPRPVVARASVEPVTMMTRTCSTRWKGSGASCSRRPSRHRRRRRSRVEEARTARAKTAPMASRRSCTGSISTMTNSTTMCVSGFSGQCSHLVAN